MSGLILGRLKRAPSGRPICRCGAEMIRHGRTRDGHQRWRCKPCNVSRADVAERPRGNWLKPAKVATLYRAILDGLSIRESAAAAGVSKKTAGDYARLWMRPLCGCGQSVTHQGWCSVRVKRHPARQAWLRKSHAMHSGRAAVRRHGEAAAVLALRLLAQGMTTEKVAALVGISPRAIEGMAMLPEHERALLLARFTEELHANGSEDGHTL